jgi:hypothetical protein
MFAVGRDTSAHVRATACRRDERKHNSASIKIISDYQTQRCEHARLTRPSQTLDIIEFFETVAKSCRKRRGPVRGI